MIKRMSIIALLSVTLCMSAGCGAKLNPYNAVHNYQYEYAVQKFRKVANAQAKKKKIGRNYSLPFLHLASASFQGGGYALAEEALSEALPLMERIQEDTSKNIAAIMGTEDNRQYKGDPYERAMAHFYLGLIRYYHGEYDRALALFRRSLVDDMDTNSSQESDLEDFAIVSLMAAKSYALLDEPDNARVMLDKVSSYVTDPSAFTEFREHFLTDNFTMLIGDGVGPYKTSVGAGRAAIRIMSVPSPVATIQIIIDDVDLGNALLCSNVVDQASAHTASGGRRALQAVKGFFNEVGKQTIGAGLMRSKSDSRSWILLPHELYLFSTSLKPGMYTVSMKCFDSAMKELPRYEQRWYYVPVAVDARDTIMFFQTGLDKCNKYKKIERQRVLTPLQLQDTNTWK